MQYLCYRAVVNLLPEMKEMLLLGKRDQLNEWIVAKQISLASTCIVVVRFLTTLAVLHSSSLCPLLPCVGSSHSLTFEVQAECSFDLPDKRKIRTA